VIDQQAVFDDPSQFSAAQRIGIEHQFTAARRIPHPHPAIGLCARRADIAPNA